MDPRTEYYIEREMIGNYYLNTPPDWKLKEIQATKQKCADAIEPYSARWSLRHLLHPILVKQSKNEVLTENEKARLSAYNGSFATEICRLIALHLATDAEVKKWKDKAPDILTINLAGQLIHCEPTMIGRMKACAEQLIEEIATLEKLHKEMGYKDAL